MKTRIFLWLIVLLVVFSSSALGQEKPNIVFITFDTLRPDHLGCYGYSQQTSPNIDALAQDAVLFSQAVTPVPLTTPSHASIFSGLYPQSHKLLHNGGKLRTKQKVLAEILKEKGYATAGFVSAYLVEKKTKMDRGFDAYSDRLPNGKRIKISNSKTGRKSRKFAAMTIDEALAWLKKNKQSPFFVWIHLYDPHWPYSPPTQYLKNKELTTEKIKELNALIRKNTNRVIRLRANKSVREAPLTTKNKQLITSLYDGEITYADQELGRLFAYLKENNLYDESAIIFLGDHGEMTGEKFDFFGHALFIYEGSIRIPLIMKLPGVAPRKVDPLVRTIDVMPTLLSYLNVEDKEKRDGLNLLPLMKNEKEALAPKFSYIETLMATSPFDRQQQEDKDGHPYYNEGQPPNGEPEENEREQKRERRRRPRAKLRLRIGVRTNTWKYWKEDEKEYLFHLEVDPQEEKNLAKENKKELKEFQAIVEPYVKKFAPPKKPKKMDPELLEQLKSLGYL